MPQLTPCPQCGTGTAYNAPYCLECAEDLDAARLAGDQCAAAAPPPQDWDADGWPLCGHVLAQRGCPLCNVAPQTRRQLHP